MPKPTKSACARTEPDTLSLRDAEIIDGLSQSGHPHILHELAAIGDYRLVQVPSPHHDDDELATCVISLSTELGDVARGAQGREGFQEVDFAAFFGPICKWAARR